ncbi:MAG: Asp-tRNA(Asn)/Glu-tRNA(Gln) amidotransferase subunit GatB, partial [Bacilli bacterium]|nr:Asp-tRNA(Asn)/Glu-tRNA(Gln) amidotransferase subunit GatB [Bacilli bacterium]
MLEFEPTIGLEVHVELKTKSKVFSDSLNSYGMEPNMSVNVSDLGYPGTLPSLNKEVINLALKAALILNCKINNRIHFDRKNYFYPDNSKNYQITQDRTPIGYDGYIEIMVDGILKRIGIERVHIEEDTAKSTHLGTKTLLDFNRAGVPLIEIVTKPELSSGKEASLYLEKLRELLLYGEISDVKIEEGSMRCDANVSIKEKGTKALGTKTEIKNIGSITNVEKSINYEIERQTELINNGESVRGETRRFDEKNNKTILMRIKDKNSDYRYFPEPDIPIIEIDDNWLLNIKNNIPRLAHEREGDYVNLGINNIVINKLIQNKEIGDFFESLLTFNINFVLAANLLTTDVVGYLNKNNSSLQATKLTPDSFKRLVELIDNKEISSKMG